MKSEAFAAALRGERDDWTSTRNKRIEQIIFPK